MNISSAISIICPVAEPNSETQTEKQLLTRIRRWILLFIVLLVISGVTAFPVQTELHVMMRFQNLFPGFMHVWLVNLTNIIDQVARNYPYLLYGYDWLAYSHIVIALFFFGVYKNPIQNAWVLRVGMAACLGVFVLAFICGPLRGIPFFWTMIDCSFGFFGMFPLLIVQKLIRKLEKQNPILTVDNHQI
jgi:hypothetical protein